MVLCDFIIIINGTSKSPLLILWRIDQWLELWEIAMGKKTLGEVHDASSSGEGRETAQVPRLRQRVTEIKG
jgi:hypothetical protein